MQHQIHVRLNGLKPLLMENGRMVDPFDPIVKEIAKFDGLHHSKKTETKALETDKLRWRGSVYSDAEGHVILPAANMLGCLKKSAARHRLGPTVQAGIDVLTDAPLSFNGNGQGKTVDELVELPEYAHRIRCKRGVMLTRPIFNQWSAEFDLFYDDLIINREQVADVLQTAGAVGIGAWPARFGKFTVEETDA